MLERDLLSYAETNWNDFIKPVSDISKNEHTHIPLVMGAELLYNFDAVTDSLFSPEKKPASADGMKISANRVEFIEFKSGFKRKITTNSFDERKAECKYTRRVCEDYWNLFFKEQKKERSELISSIRLKAIESYITLEKHILPKCQQTDSRCPLIFTVVIDEDAVEVMEDTLAEVAGAKETKGNPFSEIRSSLQRLTDNRDADGKAYFYDSVEVLSAVDFQNMLQL